MKQSARKEQKKMKKQQQDSQHREHPLLNWQLCAAFRGVSVADGLGSKSISGGDAIVVFIKIYKKMDPWDGNK